MKRYFTLCLGISCLLVTTLLTAQNNRNWQGRQGKPSPVSVSGKVIAATSDQPLAFATISLFSKRDSSLVAGAISNEDGTFLMEARPGRFYAIVDFLSYEAKAIDSIAIQRGATTYDIGVIKMLENATTLAEVEVTGERSQMQLHLDKRVFNVGKDMSNIGRTASDILDNLPSVQVDIEGNVSLRGSENVRILVDGKPSGLIGIGSTDALRRLQGDLIDRIEVITNPSARYEAEGEVGIINIVLKKGKREGVNGSFGLRVGYPENFGASYSLNFRKRKMNVFSNFGIDYRENPGSGAFFQQFIQDNGDVLTNESDRSHRRGGLGGSIQLGSDLYLNQHNTITGAVLYKYSKGDNVSKLVYRDFDANNVLINSVTRTDNEEEPEHNFETSLNYQKTFKEKDRKWTIDFRYFLNDETELSNITEIDLDDQSSLFQSSNNTEDETNVLFQTDYIHPIGADGRFETGLRTNLRSIDNEFMVEEQLSNGEWIILPGFDDHLKYEENIHAAYAIYGNKYKQLSYQLGLRAEYSDIRTELIKSNDINDRNYLDWFPSAHFSYEINKENQLQLSYSRRLSRPRFRHLLPFSGYNDSRRLWHGNPDLNPEYTNSWEVGYLQYFKNGSLLSSVYYRHRNGVIQRITLPIAGSDTLEIFPVNLSEQDAYGLEFAFSYNFAKWWSANANFDFYRAITNGSYEGRDLSNDTYTWSSRMNTKLTFFKDVDFQLSYRFRAPQNTTQGSRKAMYSFDVGLSKDILKGKGTLTFSARDIFNTRKWRSTIDEPDFYSETEFQWRSRQFTLNFNYRLNQKKSRRGQRGGNREQGGGDDMGF